MQLQKSLALSRVVGFLDVHFAVDGKLTTPCLKLGRTMLETWNLVRKYTHM